MRIDGDAVDAGGVESRHRQRLGSVAFRKHQGASSTAARDSVSTALVFFWQIVRKKSHLKAHPYCLRFLFAYAAVVKGNTAFRLGPRGCRAR